MNYRQLRIFLRCMAGALFALIALWIAIALWGGGQESRVISDNIKNPENPENPDNSVPVVCVGNPGSPEKSDNGNDVRKLLAMLSAADTVRRNNPYEAHFDSMPPGGIKMKINPVGGALGRVFNDSNYLHLASAEAIGISPLTSPAQAWCQGVKLERLHTCQAYYLDNLTHSMPFLVPKAHRLLTDIGLAFRDSLQRRGGGDYRIKVTSVLRTPRLVKQLRRRNRNAVDTSAHLFATTFDISYLKFICDDSRIPRTQEDMKNLLAEVVDDMRARGRCYVKYERKQSCFHITAR